MLYGMMCCPVWYNIDGIGGIVWYGGIGGMVWSSVVWHRPGLWTGGSLQGDRGVGKYCHWQIWLQMLCSAVYYSLQIQMQIQMYYTDVL